MMAIMQNAFANTSSSIIIAKMQGNIVDVLMPPLSAGELTLGFAVGGIARGLVVGIAVAAATTLFVPLHLQHWGFVLFTRSRRRRCSRSSASSPASGPTTSTTSPP